MNALVSSTFALQHVFLSFAFVCPHISTCSFPLSSKVSSIGDGNADKFENLAAACELKQEIRPIETLSASINTTRLGIGLGVNASSILHFEQVQSCTLNSDDELFSSQEYSFQIREE